MKDFRLEESFRRDQYETCLKRLHYDERDAASYQNLLDFLWGYVTDPQSVEDREGLLEDYMHWNEQMIDHCYIHLPHDLPYIHVRRAYQAVCALMAGDPEEGQRQLDLIGEDLFAGDGLAPKKIMLADGTVYGPMSRLFLIYNFAKYYHAKGLPAEEAAVRSRYSHAFTIYDDEDHQAHDDFYREQMEDLSDQICYPVFDRVYRVKKNDWEFFVYYDKNRTFPADQCL